MNLENINECQESLNPIELKENLFRCVNNWCPEDVKKALKQGADINTRDDEGRTPLHRAAWNAAYWDRTDIVELLIEEGADVSAKDKYGFTPLHNAAWNGHTELVKLLLEKGADINARDDRGDTPLQKAANNGWTEVVELLKQHGAV